MFSDNRSSALGVVSLLAALVCGMVLYGCAGTGAGMAGAPAPIPEGMGRLVLECGGISQVNFYVIDEATDEEVYSETPRLPGSSPLGYERGGQSRAQVFDLPAGAYTVIVNTDIEDPVEIPNVAVVMGETRYVRVPLGRFQLLFYDVAGNRRQVPFLIYDYRMNTRLGRGMTSTEIRYFILPTGNYKVRIENSSSGMDEIRPVQISFGRTQNITIGGLVEELEPEDGDGPEQP